MSKLSDRIGAFTTIPNSVIKLWPGIGVDGVALFVYLRYRTNSETEIAFPGYALICAETGLTRRRIALAIRSLEKAGILDRKKRFGQSTIYVLKLPRITEKDKYASSPTGGLLATPVVQHMDSSSPAYGLSVVQQVDTNKIDFNKIEKNKNAADAATPTPLNREEHRQRIIAALGAGERAADGLTAALETLTGRKIDPRNKTASGYLADLREWKATPDKCRHFAHYAQVVMNAPRADGEPWRGRHWKPTLKEVWESWSEAMRWRPEARVDDGEVNITRQRLALSQ